MTIVLSLIASAIALLVLFDVPAWWAISAYWIVVSIYWTMKGERQ